jgi:hypothetical protein
MIGQILPNNNERCYSNFSPTFREVNTPLHGNRMQDAGKGRQGLKRTKAVGVKTNACNASDVWTLS